MGPMSEPNFLRKCLFSFFQHLTAGPAPWHHGYCHCQPSQITFIFQFELFGGLKDFASVDSPGVPKNEISRLTLHENSLTDKWILIGQLYPVAAIMLHTGVSRDEGILCLIVVGKRDNHQPPNSVLAYSPERNHSLHRTKAPFGGGVLVDVQILHFGVPSSSYLPPPGTPANESIETCDKLVCVPYGGEGCSHVRVASEKPRGLAMAPSIGNAETKRTVARPARILPCLRISPIQSAVETFKPFPEQIHTVIHLSSIEHLRDNHASHFMELLQPVLTFLKSERLN